MIFVSLSFSDGRFHETACRNAVVMVVKERQQIRHRTCLKLLGEGMAPKILHIVPILNLPLHTEDVKI